jgi:excisionase family DNA binding protein
MPPDGKPMSRLLTTSEAAKYLGLSEESLERYRYNGSPSIPFLRVGAGRGRILYRIEDLDAYLASCVRFSTSDRGPG